MSLSGSGLITFNSIPSIHPPLHSKSSSFIPSSSIDSSPELSPNIDTKNNESVKFNYSRASPSVRYPNLKISQHYPETRIQSKTQFIVSSPVEESHDFYAKVEDSVETQKPDFDEVNDEKTHETLGSKVSKKRVKRMNRLALKRDKYWRDRVKYFTDRILGLKSGEYVADVLDDTSVPMTPTDFCFLVKWVGQTSWQRALEAYEWLNLKHWYSPKGRMLATIIAVLGKANQEELAVEVFTRGESSIEDTVQVYNAMMGVYARSGQFDKVKQMLDLLRERGCEPDLVSLNTLINARMKSGAMVPNLAMQLLNEVRSSRVRPDIITYNTLISACSRESNLEEAIMIFNDMVSNNCLPDLWTYNAMISVYGRCGHSKKAEELFRELESKGFFPDAVTYNSLLYAFSKEGNTEKVKDICEEMVKMGFGRDEMTYNTIIHMYGKQGRHDQALQLYRDMKSSGRSPDAVTYTVLIDSLGKANKIVEASNVMSEMLDAGVKPTLRTYSALICAYAKAGKRVEAEDTFNCMLRSGIKADRVAYSLMLDFFMRFNEIKKAMKVYKEMINDGFKPDNGVYEVMLQVFVRENKLDDVERIVRDMEELNGMNPQVISSILVKGGCYDHAAKMLKVAISNGYELDQENFLSILSSYSSSGRYSEACELLEFLRGHVPDNQMLTEALIVILCKAKKLDSALEEYRSKGELGSFKSRTMYESLIQECMHNELFDAASQVFSDMRFSGAEPSEGIYLVMVSVYCKMGLPETAHHLLNYVDKKGSILDNVSVYIEIIETYGKLKIWQKAESLVGNLRQTYSKVDRRIWNALIHAYAFSGCYERARAIFNTMMRDGPSPTVDSVNGLLQALIVDRRLNELYVVIQELQDMGFKISKSSILLMLEAFVKARNLFEVQKVYHGMKASGYLPTMHLYRMMIGLLCEFRKARDAEAMLREMEEAGFKPDLRICNSMLKLYSVIEEYKKIAFVYQKMQDAGLEPDEETYNTLIIMYCRDRRPEEGLSLMHDMRKHGLEPKLDTYKSLIAAFGKLQLLEQAEELFDELRSSGYKLDRSFYHLMMKMYRTSGDHLKAENLLAIMKEAGIEPTLATMHLLMVSYGQSGLPEEAEKVLKNLRTSGMVVDTLPYSSVIDAYFRKGDIKAGIKKLTEMMEAAIEPDHRIWTCFIRAASLSEGSNEAINILNALQAAGFDLPIRLLREKSESLVSELDKCLEKLEVLKDNAAFNFVNALVDLLWAFELRASASWVFQLAIKRNIYRPDIFRVAEKDWGADFRKLSAGSALVGLTLWLDHMQDASLEGHPQSPKSVVLITGAAEYNMVSLDSTLKAYLWEMGSPFLPCKTRDGVLVAKAHSLRMWLKDSPFCLDLELKDALNLPKLNSMQLLEGCFIRRGLVPAFKDITERLGIVSPKKFSRLALLPDDKRYKVIEADIEGRKEKLEKAKKIVDPKRAKIIKKHKRMKYIREALMSEKGAIGVQKTFKPIGAKNVR
ncbi:PREDICTED: pentatricopeptide repeat-containing protein At3g18110, chloroplastic [Lupinus angustifolius]|uniref:pentatricopeptide repeat-containing protein At3g18110, chloroplastic n=1 Tax=Lupinus angustifolius TaxID=3871 RepID=UPI00092F8026|nr:PREDICTED: pentatricopeptide repeat-containing protein At3g18110, chloroplastic [Lupinus angustifolius]